MGVSASARHPRQDWPLTVHPGPADAIDDVVVVFGIVVVFGVVVFGFGLVGVVVLQR